MMCLFRQIIPGRDGRVPQEALDASFCEDARPSSAEACNTHSCFFLGTLTAERASHDRKCLGCIEALSKSRGFGSSSTVSGTSMSGERSKTTMLTDHIPGARALGTSFSSTIGLSTCLRSSCLKRGLLRGGLRLEVRRIRSGASRDRHGDMVHEHSNCGALTRHRGARYRR